MKINLGVLIDNLGTRLSLDILTSASWLDQEISQIQVLKRSSDSLQPDVLYITDCRLLGKLSPGPATVNILCYNSTYLSLKQKPQNMNLFLANGVISESDLLNTVLDTVTELPNENIPAEMLDSLLSQPDLFSFCGEVYKLFGNPALVTDGDGQVLAFTKCVVEEERYWQALRDSVFRELRPDPDEAWPRIVTLEDNSTSPAFRMHGGRRVIVSPVLANGIVVAYLCIPELGRTMSQGDLRLAESVRVLLDRCLRFLYSGPSSLVTQNEHFMALLLSGQKIPSVRLIILQEALGWHFPHEMLYVVVIRPKDSAGNPRRCRDIMDLLPAEYTSWAVHYNHDVVLLLNVPKPIENFEEDLAPLIAPLKGLDVRVGISRSFHQLATTYECYQQALEALTYGSHFCGMAQLHTYEQHVIFHILKCYAEQGNDLRDLCHPGILHLKELDRINGTTYLDTFRHYILSGRSLRRTADALFIHRNTVSYHVTKCLDDLNVDLDNGDHLFQITLSLKIADYLEMTNPGFRNPPFQF